MTNDQTTGTARGVIFTWGLLEESVTGSLLAGAFIGTGLRRSRDHSTCYQDFSHLGPEMALESMQSDRYHALFVIQYSYCEASCSEHAEPIKKGMRMGAHMGMQAN